MQLNLERPDYAFTLRGADGTHALGVASVQGRAGIVAVSKAGLLVTFSTSDGTTTLTRWSGGRPVARCSAFSYPPVRALAESLDARAAPGAEVALVGPAAGSGLVTRRNADSSDVSSVRTASAWARIPPNMPLNAPRNDWSS